MDELVEGDDLIEETKEANGSLSDLNETLYDCASLYGNKTPFTGTPNLRELVRLGQGHCRMSCSLKNKDGVRTPSACKKIVVECKCHAENRTFPNWLLFLTPRSLSLVGSRDMVLRLLRAYSLPMQNCRRSGKPRRRR